MKKVLLLLLCCSLFALSACSQHRKVAATTDPVFVVVEQMPEFPGGQTALLEFLSTHVQYPAAAGRKNIQGKVILKFIVNEDGSLTDMVVEKGVDRRLDREAIRLVKPCPAGNRAGKIAAQ